MKPCKRYMPALLLAILPLICPNYVYRGLVRAATGSPVTAKGPGALSWSPASQQRIDRFLATTRGRVAVFDADGTLWADDVGEAFLRWLIAERRLIQMDYSRNIYAEYERRVQHDKAKGYVWAVSVMAGLRETDVKEWAARFFQKEFAQRIYRPQKELIARLQHHGLHVWIVSASNRWIIQAGAPYVGVDPARVAGIDLEVKGGVLTDRVKEPVTYREGKVAAIKRFIGHQPDLVCGDSSGDRAMLEYSRTLALLLVHKPDSTGEMVDLARQKNWLVQYFPLLAPWQAKAAAPVVRQ